MSVKNFSVKNFKEIEETAQSVLIEEFNGIKNNVSLKNDKINFYREYNSCRELYYNVAQYVYDKETESIKKLLENEYKKDKVTRIVNEKSKSIKEKIIKETPECKKLEEIKNKIIKDAMKDYNINEKEAEIRKKTETKSIDEQINEEIKRQLPVITDEQVKDYLENSKNGYKKINNSDYYMHVNKSIPNSIQCTANYLKYYCENSDNNLEDFKLTYEAKNNDPRGGNNLNRNENGAKILEEELNNLIQNNVKQIIITGPPGTGKTRVALELAKKGIKEFKEKLDDSYKELNKEENYFVQFHPSYDYTDFVEGLRPFEVGKDNDTKMVFRKVDGIFKSFCRAVVETNKEILKKCEIDKEELPNFYFIIDEINRADLSKVLGELMFSLESDKRGESNTVQTQYQNIGNCYNRDGFLIKGIEKTTSDEKGKDKSDEKSDKSGANQDIHNDDSTPKGLKITGYDDCFEGGFYIPENIIIIGTMNDIDRSVESMDFALRRRFTWVNAKVDKNMLTNAFNSKYQDKNGEDKKDKDDNYEYVFFNHIKQDRELTSDNEYKNEVIREVINKIDELNDYIKASETTYGVNENYYISQGYFKSIPSDKTTTKDILDYVWKYSLESLISEYVRGQHNASHFVDGCKKIFDDISSMKQN